MYLTGIHKALKVKQHEHTVLQATSQRKVLLSIISTSAPISCALFVRLPGRPS